MIRLDNKHSAPNVRGTRHNLGVTPRERKTFFNFVRSCAAEFGWPEEDARRCLALHLGAARTSEQDIEIYLNYPEYTVEELARAYNLSDSAVRRALDRVRRAWPSLLRDPDVNQHGCPALHHMLRIETSANSDDRLNSDRVIKF